MNIVWLMMVGLYWASYHIFNWFYKDMPRKFFSYEMAIRIF
jgi:hypothetical protein